MSTNGSNAVRKFKIPKLNAPDSDAVVTAVETAVTFENIGLFTSTSKEVEVVLHGEDKEVRNIRPTQAHFRAALFCPESTHDEPDHL